MQRCVGPNRTTRRGTRFVSAPAGAERSRLLSRGQARITPLTPQATREVAVVQPLAAVRRAARSLVPAAPMASATSPRVRARTMRWAPTRQALRDPRSLRAVGSPR